MCRKRYVLEAGFSVTIQPRGTYRKTINGREVTFLVYSWRSTDAKVCRADYVETVTGLGSLFFEGSGRLIVSFTVDNNGFAVGYVPKSEARPYEIEETLALWLQGKLFEFYRVVVSPVVGALTDYGKDLWTAVKVLWGACVVILVVFAVREVREWLK